MGEGTLELPAAENSGVLSSYGERDRVRGLQRSVKRLSKYGEYLVPSRHPGSVCKRTAQPNSFRPFLSEHSCARSRTFRGQAISGAVCVGVAGFRRPGACGDLCSPCRQRLEPEPEPELLQPPRPLHPRAAPSGSGAIWRRCGCGPLKSRRTHALRCRSRRNRGRKTGLG